ncbi:hypothetical protein KAR91_67890 [Candidatus Pacearchaeota archaeon]|nr:hypothetical protein [Candidatus Pacearchaeota archaeon]
MRKDLINAIQKEAAFAQNVFSAAAVVGMAKFLDVMLDYLSKKKVKRQNPEFYAKMLSAHPELKKEDPKLVARYWASLYHFAPYMAQDALASGAFIRQSIARGLPSEFGGPAPDTYLTLTDIENKLTKGRVSSSTSEALKKLPDILLKGFTIPGPILPDNNPAG